MSSSMCHVSVEWRSPSIIAYASALFVTSETDVQTLATKAGREWSCMPTETSFTASIATTNDREKAVGYRKENFTYSLYKLH